eukprot:4546931-Pleurochrysis_carterae.AAC.2
MKNSRRWSPLQHAHPNQARTLAPLQAEASSLAHSCSALRRWSLDRRRTICHPMQPLAAVLPDRPLSRLNEVRLHKLGPTRLVVDRASRRSTIRKHSQRRMRARAAWRPAATVGTLRRARRWPASQPLSLALHAPPR